MEQQSNIENNRYAGHPPATIQWFGDLPYAKGPPELGKRLRLRQESSFFDFVAAGAVALVLTGD
jgi:hypothetical protein